MSDEERQIRRICKRLGIKLGKCKVHDGRRWSYDGKILDIYHRFSGWMGVHPAADSMHDIAHWVCCPNTRKQLPEFGLGEGVDTKSRYAERQCSVEEAVQEEQFASMLGILMERAAGMNWRECWVRHGWSNTSLSELVEVRRNLKSWLEHTDTPLEKVLEICK